MSLLTSFLKLFKWDTSDANDLEEEFDIDTSMNGNWDKLDEAIEDLDTNKVDKVDGKGLSTNDFTNEDKEKLDGLENYDDTEIKQDIEDIQANDAKQDELIQKLKDNSINVTTEEATSLHVEDASILPAKLDVRGNHSQETREGYNLWDYLNVVNASVGGLTIDKDYENGYITVNGTPNNNYVNLCSSVYIDDLLEDGQTYTLWQEIYADSNTRGVYLQLMEDTPGGGTNYYSRDGAVTVTIDKEKFLYRIVLQTASVEGTGTLTNYKNRYMLYKGTNTKAYELPGASPSINYPSEVRIVGDNVNIFPINTEYFELAENGIKNKANSVGKTITEINVKKGQSIKVGFKLFSKPSENTTFTCVINDVENSSLNIGRFNNYNLNQKYEFSYIATENVTFKYVLNGNSTNEIFEFQLWAQVDELTNYSKYGQGSVEIKKINKNYYDVGESINDYFVTAGSKGSIITQYNASYYVACDIAEGIMNIKTYNTSGWNWIAKWLKINKNTNYTISLNKSTTSLTVLGFNSVEVGTEGDILAELNSSKPDFTFNSGDYKFYAVSFYPPAGLEIAIQVETGDLNTNFEEHQEQSYILDIQKPMLKGDYFVKESDGWKEVHGWNKEFFANIINNAITSTSNMHITIPNFSNNKALLPSNSEIASIFSNVFKPVAFANIDKVDYGIGIYYASDSLVIRNKDYAALQDYKNSLNNEDFYFYYKLATPTKLPCTEAQSNVLDQLNELDLFKGTNNIITAESLALMQMQYIADTETYIDNRIDEKLANINQQILEIAGGN